MTIARPGSATTMRSKPSVGPFWPPGNWAAQRGLPVTIVVSTTLKELERERGHAVTGGGSLLPMSEVIRQASAAHHYLVVFDDHIEEPLYLGRSRRLALEGATNRVVRQGPWVHVSWLHRAGVSQRGPPSSRRLGRRRQDRHHRRDPGLRRGQPPRQSPAAGRPEDAETAAPNGYLRRSWTPARLG